MALGGGGGGAERSWRAMKVPGNCSSYTLLVGQNVRTRLPVSMPARKRVCVHVHVPNLSSVGSPCIVEKDGG